MLTFLTGVDTAGKRKTISEKISGLLDEGKKVVLIVPEQSSFDRDREFLFSYGEIKSNRLKVTSFTHFSEDILDAGGKAVKPRSDDTARAVLMSLAVREVSDGLEIYRRFAGRQDSISRLLSVYDEMKQAGLTHKELLTAGEKTDGLLKTKTRELSAIFAAFEALLTARFSDPSENLNKAAETAAKSGLCSGAILFFDGFRGFTGAQLGFMSAVIPLSEETYVSVTAPGLAKTENSEAFFHSLRNAQSIKRIAASNGVRIREENTDRQNDLSAPAALRASLFGTESAAYTGEADHIKTVKAADIFEECELAALEIKRLLLSGLRCRDIAVFERGGNYASVLIPVLKKYGIPVFEDKRHPFFEYPLIRLVLAACDTAANGFDSEKVFACIKTGLCGVTDDECSELENYVYCRDINYGRWQKPFTENPDGFGAPETDDSRKRLKRLNVIREKVISPLCGLAEQLKKGDAENSCRAVYLYLKEINAAEHFLNYARFLYENGSETEAAECGRVWDECMSALDSLNAAVNGTRVEAKEFFSLLKLMLCSGSIGDIPAGIDEIVIGEADRMRFLSPKAVIVLGVNEGVFPAPSSQYGVFSAREERLLCMNGFVLESLPENRYAEERLIAFDTLTCTDGTLTLFFSESSADGTKLEPSEIIREVKRIFPETKTLTARDYPAEEFLSTPASAFEEYASRASENTVFSRSLKAALESREDCRGSIESLDRAVNGAKAFFEDKTVSAELFGNDLRSSASQTESYHKCPFMYFCQYGMGVSKPRPAALDQRITGLLVHKVLEDMFKKFTNDRLREMEASEVEKNIGLCVDDYVNEFMGGYDSLSEAVKRDLIRSKNTVKDLMERFISEFGACGFITCRTELKIGGADSDIPAYTLTLPDGGSITVRGSIDRVDMMKHDGNNYVRIIDYKTGGKEFRLSDVFDGLNMQMLIYLFALCQNGKELFGDMLPAGILYVPAKSGGKTVGRLADEKEIFDQKLKNGRMNGLLLEDESILRGMDSDAAGIYIDAKIDAKGNMKGAFLSLKEFELLHKRIDEILIKTGTDIKNGIIPAYPADMGGQKDICRNCDYSAVCLHESDGDYRPMLKLDHAAARAMLNGEDDENG